MSPHTPQLAGCLIALQYIVGLNLTSPKEDRRLLALLVRSICVENRNPQQALIVNEDLIDIHSRISESLDWLETAKYIGTDFDGGIGKRAQIILIDH